MGRKYVIELDDTPYNNGDDQTVWRVKGFNIFLDRSDLDYLEEYKEPEKETLEPKVGDVIDIGVGLEAMVTFVSRNNNILYYIFHDGSCNKLFGIAEIAKLKVIRHEDSIDKFVNRRE